MNHYPLSVALITKNEAHQIRATLESVKWAQEIIVIDSGSTDGTLDICKAYTPQVFSMDWPGFGIQKNRAIERCTQPWILVLDADEVLSEALQLEIQNLISKPTSHQRSAVYTLTRQNYYLGKPLKHGFAGNDRVPRLFTQGAAHYNQALVHEHLEFQGPAQALSNPLHHYTCHSLSQNITKMNTYSTLGSNKYQQQKHSKVHSKMYWLIKARLHQSWTFFKGFLLKRGFLDGIEGYLHARLHAEGAFYKYIKAAYADTEANPARSPS